jgi:hypothetical protein
VWPIAILAILPLVNKATFAIATLFPFAEVSGLALADRIATTLVSAAFAGTLFGFALAALARHQHVSVLALFLAATALGTLVLWPLQSHDPAAFTLAGEDLSPTWWLGLFLAIGFAWVRRSSSASSESASVAP